MTNPNRYSSDFDELRENWINNNPDIDYRLNLKRSDNCRCCCRYGEIKCPHCSSTNHIFSRDPWIDGNAYCLDCNTLFDTPYS